MKLTEDDLQVILAEPNGGYDFKLQFCSLEGYECQWKEEQANELKQQILENQEFVANYHKPYKVRVTYDKLEEDRDNLKQKLEEKK